ncbi:hypothetical protein [Posidoniimonas polymericola]|uniref:hypothetical protein n=1 Tax=Posidoniimonas polymericola TaxID=2528002 RepID=UPI0011B647DF|nr:hypothetical protein [Posidoniimonas polymericola]
MPLLLATSAADAADEFAQLFSGPQVGEELPPFEALPAFGEAEKVAVLDGAMDGPVLLVFVHQVTRPSIGLTRLLMEYAATKQTTGLQSRLVFLTADPTDTKAFLQRARRALPRGVEPSISTEGIEGPGAYGLNRKITLTVLVASKGVVTANFPLVQPSIQADAPKIGYEIAKVLGGAEAPTLKEMGFDEQRMGMARRQQVPERDALYRQYMAPVIQKTATPNDVVAAAKAVEEFAASTPWFKERVHRASKQITEGPRLTEYGTDKAQEYLKKWATQYAPSGQPAAEEPRGESPPAESADESTEASTGDNG